MACGEDTAKPEYWKPDYAAFERRNVWPHNFLLTLRQAGVWIVRCRECPAIHVWSFGNIYKVHTDPMPAVVLGEN